MTVKTIEAQPAEKKKLRVAAYCRVSTDNDDQRESLETQKAHYEAWIRLHSEWECAGIFYDFGITGTKADVRDGLQALLYECRIGRIDYVLTKSVSRFSRNTTDCLELVRELLSYNVPIYFEKEKLDTGSMETELVLAILSSLAQEESESISKNVKWGNQKRIEKQNEESRREIQNLGNIESGMMLRETEKLLHFIDTAETQDAYNEELFVSFVDSIIVYSRDSVGFKLKCGLTLKEALCTDTRS